MRAGDPGRAFDKGWNTRLCLVAARKFTSRSGLSPNLWLAAQRCVTCQLGITHVTKRIDPIRLTLIHCSEGKDATEFCSGLEKGGTDGRKLMTERRMVLSYLRIVRTPREQL